MPRQRGAADQRQVRRKRGEHDNKTSGGRAQQRTDTHAVAEPTTESLKLYINQAMRYPLLTADEEIQLAQAIERGDLAAKERLINSNLRLVIKFARRYQGFGLPLGDLVQEAMLGLIRAVEKFDWRRGYKDSTSATLWIRDEWTPATSRWSSTANGVFNSTTSVCAINDASTRWTKARFAGVSGKQSLK